MKEKHKYLTNLKQKMAASLMLIYNAITVPCRKIIVNNWSEKMSEN